MSKWLNAGTILGAVAGAVSAAAALWQVLQPSPIDTAEDVVAALTALATR